MLLGGCVRAGRPLADGAYRNADRRMMIARQGLDSGGGYARLPAQGQKTLLHAIMACNTCRRGDQRLAPADGWAAHQGLEAVGARHASREMGAVGA